VGSIGGRVIDRDTQQPVRWAGVTIAQASRQFQAVTSADTDGRFLVDNLQPGPYVVLARKPGYVPLASGARKPRDPGTPIDVTAGTTANADVLLSRGGAIEGRILNEYGDPVQDVGIQALRLGYDSTGRRTIPTGASTRTDDLGWFRLHSLPPGMYFVEASRAALAPPALNDQQEAVQRPKPFARTYYPGTVRLNQAGYLLVEKNHTRSIEFSLSVEPVNLVSGTVMNSRGEVPEMTGAALRYAGGAPLGGFSLGEKRNQFALTGVPPGDYVLVITARTSGADLEFAMRSVTINGRDVIEPLIQTAPGVTLDGIVEIEARDGTSRPASVAVASISTLFPGLVADPNQKQSPVRSRPDGRFTFQSLFGPRLFRVVVDAPWALKAVMYEGQDVTDVPLDLRDQREARALRVLVTNRTGVVTGSLARDVADAAGTEVVVFSEDEKQWVFDSRYTRVSRIREDGRFEIAGLLPGRYLVAHVVDLEPGAAGDIEVLRHLRSAALAVVVTEGDESRVQLPAARTP
jgi:hypothetical protein